MSKEESLQRLRDNKEDLIHEITEIIEETVGEGINTEEIVREEFTILLARLEEK